MINVLSTANYLLKIRRIFKFYNSFTAEKNKKILFKSSSANSKIKIKSRLIFSKLHHRESFNSVPIVTRLMLNQTSPLSLFKMGKLSAKYLIRKNKANKYFLVRKKGDNDKEFLNRITHLPVQNQFLDEILKINDCVNVKVLYIQNNLLRKIQNMENFPLLTHLYLQRNYIVKMENLQVLVHLKKIYLGHNEVQVLEGMENLKKIKEIHMECQDIPKGGTLYFEPLSVQTLGETLHVLNISENSITSIKSLKSLMNLKVLTANDNLLSDIEDITSTVCEWRFLQKLSLIGNVVTKSRWYRDALIFASKSLEILDDIPIHENTRIFIEKLIEQKKILYQKNRCNMEESEKSGKDKRKSLKFANDNESQDNYLEVANIFPPAEPVYLYPAWKLRTNVNPIHEKTFLPRPYWRKRNTQNKP